MSTRGGATTAKATILIAALGMTAPAGATQPCWSEMTPENSEYALEGTVESSTWTLSTAIAERRKESGRIEPDPIETRLKDVVWLGKHMGRNERKVVLWHDASMGGYMVDVGDRIQILADTREPNDGALHTGAMCGGMRMIELATP